MMAEDIKGTEINPGVFPQRLIIALKKNGMTRKELAERIGVTPQSIGRYAKSESLPTADILRDIAVCLDVSCDWLVGLSEVSSTEVDVQAVCSSTVLNEESAKLLMPKYMRVEDYYLTPSMREDIISILKQKEIDEASDEMIDALFLGMVEDAFREGVNYLLNNESSKRFITEVAEALRNLKQMDDVFLPYEAYEQADVIDEKTRGKLLFHGFGIDTLPHIAKSHMHQAALLLEMSFELLATNRSVGALNKATQIMQEKHDNMMKSVEILERISEKLNASKQVAINGNTCIVTHEESVKPNLHEE